MIAGILFDKDGTLFDFERSWAAIIRALIDEIAPDFATAARLAETGGFDLATGRFAAGSPLVAGTNAEIAALWAPLSPGLVPDDIVARLDAAAHAAFADPAKLVPTVPDLGGHLGALRQAGYRLGLATHDSERAARRQLAGVGALVHFDFIAGYDSGHGAKPGPGMLTAFARATGLAPAAIAVVGDSRHDLDMARRGGAGLAVGVLTGPAEAGELAPFADHVIASIADLPALLARYR